MQILNLADALQLAELLDKPELKVLDAGFEMEEFVIRVLDALSNEEIEELLLLLFGNDVYGKAPISPTELAEALVGNGYLQLMDSYHKLRQTNG